LHPQEPLRQAFVQQTLAGESGPVVAALDYVTAVGQSIGPWIGSPQPRPGKGAESKAVNNAGRSEISSYTVLGADGFGRSDARPELRRFFEVDAENIALAALEALARDGAYPRDKLPAAIKTLGLDPEKPNPVAR
jgi:pyruvate dehydrogenase E1 component